MVEATKSHAVVSFREVVETHQRDLYAFAYRLTGNHHDAEDLSQEVFIKVYASLSSFRGESGLKTWIHRIAVNTYLNKRRKKALSFMRLKPDFEVDAATGIPPSDRGAEVNALRSQVNRALQQLSRQERVAFTLRVDDECSVKEVAEAMEVAEGTVKSLLFRAVRKMRKELAFLKEE